MSTRNLEPIPDDWDVAVAIAAHPDDLEYGASSAIAKWTTAGKRAAYVLATSGEAGIDAWEPERTRVVRQDEERASALAVGVTSVDFLGFADGVVEPSLALRLALCRELRRHRPQMVITGSFDLAYAGGHLNQSDHRVVGLAACDAARDAGNRWIFRELIDEGLEPWSGIRYVAVHASRNPTHYCEISEADLARGIASLEAQRAYFGNLRFEFSPSTYLHESAERAGRAAGCPLAMLFELYLV
jgi:LmbE family N-acetylglucosaminyl deacetylase